MPDPSIDRPFCPSIRWNRSNSLGNSSTGIPIPVSETLTIALRPSGEEASDRAISPFNVNLNAFESRLSSIFSHISRST